MTPMQARPSFIWFIALALAIALPGGLLMLPLLRNRLARVTVSPSSMPSSPSSAHGIETVTRASFLARKPS